MVRSRFLKDFLICDPIFVYYPIYRLEIVNLCGERRSIRRVSRNKMLVFLEYGLLVRYQYLSKYIAIN